MRRTTKDNPMLLGIGTVTFKLFFSTPEKDKRLEDAEAITDYRMREIVIREDLDDLTTMCMIRHELVHAILFTQGRRFYENYSEELMAEFVAMNFDLIDYLSKMCVEVLELNYTYFDNKEEVVVYGR